MGKQMMLQGFTITPIVQAIDLDAATAEPVNMNSVFVGPRDGEAWFASTWPTNWQILRDDYAESEKSREAAAANEAAAAKRAVRKTKKAATE